MPGLDDFDSQTERLDPDYLRNTARNGAHRMRRCSCVTTEKENIKNKIDKTNAPHCRLRGSGKN